MKIIIAYDGSGYSRGSLGDLRQAGLPPVAEVIILSVSEVWLSPAIKQEELVTIADRDIADYFQNYYDQADRDLAEAKVISEQAKEELARYFPRWTIKTEAFFGSPAMIILSRAIEFKPNLIVMGPQGLSSFSETGLGSISQKVLSDAVCSVRVTRGKDNVTPLPQRILIGFNNSPGSLTAVETVAKRKWLEKPEIRLVTVTELLIPLIPGRVFQPIPGFSEGRMKGEQKWVEALAAKALQILSNAGLSATFHVCSGNPRLVLAQEAEVWQADSIFVGANSFQAHFQPHDLGCVSSAIAARAACSVEVIR